MSSFASKPFDGQHPIAEPGDDWRGGTGLVDDAKRLVSYGNWAGPGNRLVEENKDYVAQQHQLDPHYNECRDGRLADDPRYKPIDGIDAAAKQHDTGYEHLRGQNMFTWQGMNNVREDDRRLVDDVHGEVDKNGAKYSDGAKSYASGLQGFFGSRVMGQDAVDWAGKKAGEAAAGVSGFVDGAKGWSSVGAAASGVGQGIKGAGTWLANSASEAWHGVENAGTKIAALGAPGIAGSALGFGNVAVAGAGHLAAEAYSHYAS
jgi:hypothetical protein